MTPKQFAQFSERLQRFVKDQEPKATDDNYEYGYAIGKLLAYYKNSGTDVQQTRFEEGLADGYDMGRVVVLQ